TDFGSTDLAYALALQPDGKVVAAGYTFTETYDFALARYHPDGTLDGTFGSGGLVTTDFGGTSDLAFAVVLQPDSKLVAAGSSGGEFALARYEGSVCGNGLLEASEQCDDGNRADGDCCSSACQFEAIGSRCFSDGNACTADRCDGAG